MTLSSLFLIAAAFLSMVFLWIVAVPEEDSLAGSESDDQGPFAFQSIVQAPQVVSRIFSPEDEAFISQLGSPRVQRIYRMERRKVALHWVRQTSRRVSRIMLNHRLASRHSQNLNVASEVMILVKYVELRLICGLLILLIRLLGAHTVNNLATYAGSLHQSIRKTLADAVVANGGASSSNLSTS